jgi:hypothetical protein
MEPTINSRPRQRCDFHDMESKRRKIARKAEQKKAAGGADNPQAADARLRNRRGRRHGAIGGVTHGRALVADVVHVRLPLVRLHYRERRCKTLGPAQFYRCREFTHLCEASGSSVL